MDFQKIFFLIRKYYVHLLVWPIVLAALTYFLSKDSGKTYESKTLIYAGFMSGYNIENTASPTRSSYMQVANSFDNLINIIKARNTIEIVSLKLLTSHLKTDGKHPEVISAKHYAEFLEGVPSYIKKMSKDLSYEELYNYLSNSMKVSDTSWTNIRFNGTGYYSFEALSGIKVNRLSSSDLFEISYKADDPGVAKLTLDILNSVFIEKYKSIRSQQIGTVAKFFDTKLGQIKKQLKQKEDSLLMYKMRHNIVNYEDQTGQLTAKKDQLESMYLERSIAFEAAKSSLNEIESQLKTRTGQLSKNKDIAAYRSQIAKLSSDIMKEKLRGDKANIDLINSYERKQEEINQKLKGIVGGIGDFSDFVSGVNTETVMDEWLNRLITFEETKAQLKAIDDYAKRFGGQFNSFAPIGAVLKKMEREIGVLEDEYLSLMDIYNQSRMKEHNLEKSLNIVALDKPFFPLQPVKSDRLLLVIGAFFGGLIFVIMFIFIKEVLITKINSVELASRLIGGEILGMYPEIDSSIGNNIEVQRAENLIVQTILSDYKHSGKKSYNVLVVSAHEGDGKSFMCEMIKDHIITNKITDSTFTEHDQNNPVMEPIDEPGIHFHKILPLTQKVFNPFVINRFDSSILIVSAQMKWSILERDLITTYKNSFEGKFMVLLNKIESLYFKTMYK